MKNLRRTLLLPLSALALLTGCAAVGPDYSPPVARHPAGFGQPPAGLSAGNVELAWWRLFDDPALTDLVQRALAANHDVGIAVARVDEARALLREQRQDFLPRAGAALSYETRRLGEAEKLAAQPRHTQTYRGAIDSTWEIDLFGHVRRSIEAAQALAGSREALLRGVQAGVAAEVAATWLELRGLDAELKMVAEISHSQRESLVLVKKQMSAGAASEFDRLRAEALLRNVEAATPELERRRAAAVNALATLLGEMPQTFCPPSAEWGSQPPVLRAIAVGTPGALLARRADIVAAERELAAATAMIGVETAALYPRIEARGSIGLVAGNLDALTGAGAFSGVISPVIRWAFLDIGRVRARIAASEARTQQALLIYERTVLSALRETDDAFKTYAEAVSTLDLRLLEAAANREAARLAQTRFAAGEGIYLEVLEAERADFASRRALTQAGTRQRLAVVGIYKALGGGWETCAAAKNDCRGATGSFMTAKIGDEP
ncbi:TPA: efflux transporter outer membrane subunit [Serratia marcescens]